MIWEIKQETFNRMGWNKTLPGIRKARRSGRFQRVQEVEVWSEHGEDDRVQDRVRIC